MPNLTTNQDAGTRGVGSATGKTIVCGEHFVLDGAAALAVALPGLRTRVALTTSEKPEIVSDQQLSETQMTATWLMTKLALQTAGITASMRVAVTSSIPIGRGLGSSAALAVACCTAAANFRGEALTSQDLLQRCVAVEDVVHGTSSGLDPATAMSAGGVVFRSGAVVREISVATGGALTEARWVLADVGDAPSTGAVVAHANRAKRALGLARMQSLIDIVDAASWLAARALQEDSVADLAQAMRRCAAALKDLEVTDDRMRRACAVGVSAGALAMKQTGAGLGGAVLALAPNSRIAETVASQLNPIVQSVQILTIATGVDAHDGDSS